MMMIERIVSGGQTVADRAALDAAIASGVPHGGWCPKGRSAEDGVIPERYQLMETLGFSPLARTERNVKRSDGTVILTIAELAGGSFSTAQFARRHHRPWIHLRLDGMDDSEAIERLRAFVEGYEIRILNVAGSRASKEPGLYARTFAIVSGLLTRTTT